ncbi:hypothetical protein DSM106972_063250 [Dulcicalothrix desertica PCC 7102]|uniref:DUF4329 domain-containing protein n=2 Tax=Dulcicalothrix desertica TaxID=32056 RepID=A0A3S1AJR7_9CYAN|nr:hypothetical protein DSM106972_063250 [Dulcicalothrix desertica PCC 7102]TWH53892.1 hypothetical protein CAL7102_01885 [Dulcicalothrix desertica PCC 7102]
MGLLLATTRPALGQFPFPIPKPSIPIPQLPSSIPQIPIPDLTKLLEGEAPVSTSFSDTKSKTSLSLQFDSKKFRPLTELPRSSKGGFLLRPGLFELFVQSYCLKAGTHGPSKGNGYLYAALKGSKAGIVRKILQNSARYPEIKQEDIQMLLWAITARTKISDTRPEIQQVAVKLLTSDEIFKLNGGTLGLIPKQAFVQATAHLPPVVQQVLQAEARIREMLTSTAGTTYQQLEQIAVLVGEPKKDGPTISPEQWSLHPQGFYVRYLPTGYNKTLIQLYVPDNFKVKAANKNQPDKTLLIAQNNDAGYNPAGDVAVPGDTGRQRLGMSGRPADGGTPPSGSSGQPSEAPSGSSSGQPSGAPSGSSSGQPGEAPTQQPSSTTPRNGNTLNQIPGSPSKREIFCNPSVRAALDRDWQATRKDNLERGRWVVWNSATGQFTTTNVIVGSPGAAVALGNTPSDVNGSYVVGVYHTHPPVNDEPGSVAVLGPSPFNDIVHADRRQIPSLVRDFSDESKTRVIDYLYGPNHRGEAQPGDTAKTNVIRQSLNSCSD